MGKSKPCFVNHKFFEPVLWKLPTKYEHFFNFQSLDSLEERFSGPEV